MIEAQGLLKRYGDLCAVDHVTFSIQPGESFGLLGPNGAGKSTTIQIIAGTLKPDGGVISITDQRAGQTKGDPSQASVRRSMGIAPQELAIYDELTGEENLAFFGRIYGLSGAALKDRVEWALEFAGLAERRKDRAAGYSGGMKRRLNLACALVHEPQILICDEPTVGVDPQSRNHILEQIQQLTRSGCTLLYTTHYMEEAQRLCDRVAIMDHGKILAIDTVDRLIAEHGGAALVEAELTAPPADPADLPGTLDGATLRVETSEPLQMVATLARRDVEIAALRIERPDLERVFLHLTGRRLRD